MHNSIVKDFFLGNDKEQICSKFNRERHAMDALRDLLLIKREGSVFHDIADEISSYGWNILKTGSLEDLARKQDFSTYHVGIILVEADLIDERDIESIINEIPLRWVAIVLDDDLKNPTIRDFISRLFDAYYTDPVNVEKLNDMLEHLQAIAQLAPIDKNRGSCQDGNDYCMVGTSPVMQTLYRTIKKVAAVDAPVFICGESGTGKDLTARAIHKYSSRSAGPFNAVNCGALPDNLIQSELFGHEKGSFTGASQKKIGRIEDTQGGTLFLDEIADLPLDLQVNLLRFLENNTIQRVGGLKEIPVDVRVLAATHTDLEQAVREGKFREDLYHRLNVLQVEVPALRERGDDIEILANYFFEKFASEKSLQVRGFNKESLTLMRLHDWPGNIRELINRVRRAMVMCEHRLIRPTDLGLERRHCTYRHIESLEEARDLAEREVIISALARNRFNIQHAARELGISRVTLYRLIDKHQIPREHDTPTGSKTSSAKPSTQASASVLCLTPLNKNG